ncbi:phosphatase PAP2 family protein [Chlamydiales bacterium]|nr:phosphatase PAP2 family protein [Chlamydiales bacterium]
MTYLNRNLPWIIPLLVLILFAPFSIALDLSTSSLFFDTNQGFSNCPWLDVIYTFGLYPAWIVVIGALLMLCFPQLKAYRKGCIYLILVLVIGSGLITHLILKDHWGRPRPRQIEQFSGEKPFSPFYQFTEATTPPQRSFPCGHCTMGFFFFSFYFLGKKYKWPFLSTFGLILALTLGIALSLTRIAQGGHFLSDTLVSAMIMWLTSYFLSLWILDERVN